MGRDRYRPVVPSLESAGGVGVLVGPVAHPSDPEARMPPSSPRPPAAMPSATVLPDPPSEPAPIIPDPAPVAVAG